MDDEVVFRTRARAFGSVAGEYERGRPGYPTAAVQWLVGLEPCRVVDIGAGTGKLTRQLVALGHEVTAVEPSAEMLDQLRAAVPGVRALQAGAEELPLEDGAVDVAVAAQAFHWFDPAIALPEIARLLTPGGTVGLVWNMRDERVSWVARLSEIIGDEPADGLTSISQRLSESGLFGPVEHATFTHEQQLDRGMLLELVTSRSYFAVQSPDERSETLVRVGDLYDETASSDGLTMPYVTYAYRADRL
jgi:SAM-dependent methyltransferase